MNDDFLYQRRLLIEKFEHNAIRLELTTVNVRHRKLRVKWTLEMFEDLNNIYMGG